MTHEKPESAPSKAQAFIKAAQRESEADFRAIFNAVNDAVFLHDLESGGIISVNESALELFGYSKEAMVKTSIEQLSAGTPPYTQQDAAAWMSKAAQGHPQRFEWRSRRQNGALFWSEVSMRRADLPAGAALVVTVRDIEERKQTEAALRESEERYRSLADLSPDGILVNVEGRIAYVNAAGQRMLGADNADQIIGRSPFDFIDPVHHAQVRERIKRILGRHGLNPSMDQHWRQVSGQTIELGVSAGPLVWEGKPAVQVLLRDISERKQCEDALMAAKKAAEAATHAKSAFLANMSHEIRTPLNGLFGMLQSLQSTHLQPEQAESIDIALASGRTLLNILNDILDLSRIEAGRLTLEKEPFDPARTVREVAAIFQANATDRNIALNCDLAAELPPIIGDADRLRQVLFNLVGNALKFTEKGQVTIEAGAHPVKNDPADLVLTIAVTDTGIGIPRDKLEGIFEPFTQVDATRTRKYGGSGLGLGIGRRLIELMGGQIEIESEPAKGTRVAFSIQAERASEPDPLLKQEETEREGRSRGSLNILVAEDDPVNRLVLERFLAKQGHQVVSVADGRQCLQALDEQEFDLIFMDVQMPEMDGWKPQAESETARMRRRTSRSSPSRPMPWMAIEKSSKPQG